MRRLARAKVNLALHVVGRRADGYHLLETLAVFPPVGDRLAVEAAEGGPAGRFSLAVSGPEAAALAGLPMADNLVLRAAAALATAAGRTDGGAAFRLEKHLPVAAGIGGGSADAAAALTALAALWGLAPDDPALRVAAWSLGADVPMCLASRPVRAAGIGEVLVPAPPLPGFGIVLANPRVPVSTPAVFAAFGGRFGGPLPPLPAVPARDTWLGWLAATANHLEAPASAVAPAIAGVLAALRGLPGVRLARMSGSGATCFALFDDAAAATAAAALLRRERPDWWIAASPLAGDGAAAS